MVQNSTFEAVKSLIVLGIIAYIYVLWTDKPETRPITNAPLAGEESRPLGDAELAMFIDIVARHRQAFEETDSEVTQGLIRKLRGEAICKNLVSRYFNSWFGRVMDVSTSANGQTIDKIEVALARNGFSDYLTIVDTSGHKPGSRLYNTLLNDVKVGDLVVFNGEFRYDHDNVVSDCFRETRVTLRGGMKEPAFAARIFAMKAVPIE